MEDRGELLGAFCSSSMACSSSFSESSTSSSGMCSLAESESLGVESSLVGLLMIPLLSARLVLGGGLAKIEATLLLDDAAGGAGSFLTGAAEVDVSTGSSSSSSSDSMIRRFFLSVLWLFPLPLPLPLLVDASRFEDVAGIGPVSS